MAKSKSETGDDGKITESQAQKNLVKNLKLTRSERDDLDELGRKINPDTKELL